MDVLVLDWKAPPKQGPKDTSVLLGHLTGLGFRVCVLLGHSTLKVGPRASQSLIRRNFAVSDNPVLVSAYGTQEVYFNGFGPYASSLAAFQMRLSCCVW